MSSLTTSESHLPDPPGHRALERARWTSRKGVLEIDADNDGSRWLLTLRGDLDRSTITLLEQELRMAEASSARRIVLDLRLLDFLDSSGLHTLIQADRRARRNEGRLRLIPGPPRVQRVFRLTDTEDHLPFVTDPDEA